MREIVLHFNPLTMNPNPLLLDERYDDIIIDGMMYQPMCNELEIKPYVGKELEDSIYELLAHIETFNNVKL